MSKVICAVCGTTYPDTDTQCPICGSVRPAENSLVDETVDENEGYTYVKGGRFSKSNVRKRNQGVPVTTVTTSRRAESSSDYGEEYEQPRSRMDGKRLGLVIALVCLLLIVILMFTYIGITLLDKNSDDEQPGISQNNEIHCTGLNISKLDYSMTRKGEILKLDVTATPKGCTDEIRYSEDSNGQIITVDQSGKIVCVGNGNAVVTITCGDYKKECRISVVIDESLTPPEPVEPTTPEAPVKVMLFYSNLTMNFENEKWTLFASGDVTAKELTWVSDNPAVAKVDNESNVYAVSEGETDIHAKYGDIVVASCHVKCDFKDLEVDNSQEGGDAVDLSEYHFGSVYGELLPEGVDTYGTSLKVGDKIQFGLIHKSDRSKNIYFEWERTNPEDSDQSVVASEDKLTIERVSAPDVAGSYCVFKASYEGKTYYLKVRYFA